MEYLNIFKQFLSLMIFTYILCLTPTLQGQNLTQEVQTDMEDRPKVKIQIIELTNTNKEAAIKNRVEMMTVGKSNKMEIINVKTDESISKMTPSKKIHAIRKVKSDKIDQ